MTYRMQSFKLDLPNNGTVTGAHSLPPPSSSPVQHRPLIIGLHGGCYDHQYFDALPDYSATLASTTFSIPFVSIDRSSYGGTSSILPIPSNSDFTTESANTLHRHILPTLWSEYGVTNGCTCIVLLCHSLGVMVGVASSALHAQDTHAAYPLAGLIASGMGDTQTPSMAGTTPTYSRVDDEHALCPLELKDKVMFKPGTCAPEMLDQSARLNAIVPVAEMEQFATKYLPTWKAKWAPHVRVPVFYALVEDDPFFVATGEEVERCVRAFTGSVRAEGSLIRDAPHCVELSYWSQGWYARCFGFAMECAASYGVHVARARD